MKDTRIKLKNKEAIFNKAVTYVKNITYYEYQLQQLNGLVKVYKARIDGSGASISKSEADAYQKTIARQHRIDDYQSALKKQRDTSSSILYICLYLYMLKQVDELAYYLLLRLNLKAHMQDRALSVKVSRYNNLNQEDYTNAVVYVFIKFIKFIKESNKFEKQEQVKNAQAILIEMYQLRHKDLSDLYKIK